MRTAGTATRRACGAMGWAAGGIGLFVLYLRISLTHPTDSDGANIALQAWDMLHGHLLLHGWVISDVPFYAFDLPLNAFAESFIGLHTFAVHVAAALIYLIVAACAVAMAVTDGYGASRAARAAVVVATLAAPLLDVWDRWIPLGHADHFGSSVFLLICCLLVDGAPGRRFTAPLLCLILCAGQISDVTVRYVFVPAIALVCAYHVAAARKIRGGDAANLVAAVASVPLAILVRVAMRHLGAYVMVAPNAAIAAPREWPDHAAVTWQVLRILFGARVGPGLPPPGGAVALFGSACMLAVACGLVRVAWRWRAVRQGEQMLAVAIAVSLAVYVTSALVSLDSPDYIVAILPSGAVLAARALVPARLTGRWTALSVTGAAASAALLPLSLVAVQPPTVAYTQPLATWLQAHGLRYGLADYWDGSSVTLDSGNQVQVRTVHVDGEEITPYAWETNLLWFDPARHFANFVIVDIQNHPNLGMRVERIFGKPVRTHRIKGWDVLIYQKNLLTQVKPAALRPTS